MGVTIQHTAEQQACGGVVRALHCTIHMKYCVFHMASLIYRINLLGRISIVFREVLPKDPQPSQKFASLISGLNNFGVTPIPIQMLSLFERNRS